MEQLPEKMKNWTLTKMQAHGIAEMKDGRVKW